MQLYLHSLHNGEATELKRTIQNKATSVVVDCRQQ